MAPRAGRNFGARLRSLRQRRGLAQKDLAGPGVSMSYVSRLESGDRVPSTAVVARLAAVLGIEPTELLGESGSPRQEAALLWCEAMLAYQSGEPGRAIALLGELAGCQEDELFVWAAQWTRAALLARESDPQTLLRAVDELGEAWSPGRGVDAQVEMFRAQALRRLGRPADAVRAMRTALELSAADDTPGAERVRLRARVYLAMELARSGRLGEAEQVIKELGDAPGTGKGDRMAVSAWWVRGQVESRLGEHQAAGESIRRALDLLDDADPDPTFRNRLRLAAVSLALRSPGPDLDELARTLDQVESEVAGPRSELAAQTDGLRAELALHRGDVDACWRLAEHALASGALDADDELRCRLLMARAANQAGDDARLAVARTELANLLDKIGTDVVDPVMWRDVARFALRAPSRPTG
ncbi:helix-turn-helix domain-containing protein [Gandjariella thermophila]|uniref:helix-turn-helix domain-containing protein n=1 Tax=Gandjariella thermophila TaxID=1931992 RepID=UPI0018645C9B|nr:helix-turn-helix domain-containing protein [Gandjariella thermophila]